MRGSKGACVFGRNVHQNQVTNFDNREGAATLNDMKDMLASLPQYQEQREKVSGSILGQSISTLNFEHLVFAALEYGTGVYGHF